MAGKVTFDRSKTMVLRVIAWILLIVWGGFWIWFNVASGFSEIKELGPMGLVTHLIMPALIIIVALFTILSEGFGGVLLIALGIVSYFFFHMDVREPDFVLVAFFLPAIVIGLLFTLSWIGSRKVIDKEPPATE